MTTQTITTCDIMGATAPAATAGWVRLLMLNSLGVCIGTFDLCPAAVAQLAATFPNLKSVAPMTAQLGVPLPKVGP